MILVKETVFWKLALLLSSCKSMTPTLLGPLDVPNIYPGAGTCFRLLPEDRSRASFSQNETAEMFSVAGRLITHHLKPMTYKVSVCM
jgi:hypothetical protein